MDTITVSLFWDMDLRKWTTTLGGTTEQGPIQGLVQGDKVLFNVKFVQSGVAVTLTSPVFTASAIKAQGDFTGSYLIQLSAPTGSPPLYTFTVDPLNSANLNTFLQTYRNTWCVLEIFDSANGILTTPLELQLTPGYSLSGTPTDNAPGTLVVAAGKTVTFPLSLTFPSAAGSNGQQLTTDGAGTLTWAASGSSGLTVGTTTIASGTTTRVLYDNAGVVGEYAISGTGSVAMTNSPTFVGSGSANAVTIEGENTFAGKLLSWKIAGVGEYGYIGSDGTLNMLGSAIDMLGGTIMGGVITSSTWNGDVIDGQYGGTGVANTGKTITLAGNLVTTGAFNTTFAQGATTTITTFGSTTLPVFSQNITFNGPTAARTIILPDASFTVARTDAAQTLTATQTISESVDRNGSGAGASLIVQGTASVGPAFQIATVSGGRFSVFVHASNGHTYVGTAGGSLIVTNGTNSSGSTLFSVTNGGAFSVPGTLAVTGATTLSGGLNLAPSAVKNTTYTITAADILLLVDMSASSWTATLPASPTNGEYHTIKNTATGAFTLTIGRNSKNIEGAASDATASGLTLFSRTYQYQSTTGSWWLTAST